MIFSGSHYYLIDYLVEEVLNELSEEIKEFLYTTSVVNKFCPDLCNLNLALKLNQLGEIQEALSICEQNIERHKSNVYLEPLARLIFYLIIN